MTVLEYPARIRWECVLVDRRNGNHCKVFTLRSSKCTIVLLCSVRVRVDSASPVNRCFKENDVFI